MAFPVVSSLTTSTFSTAATAHLVAMPATVNSGDLLVAMFTNSLVSAVTTPSGWTQLHSNSNTNARFGTYYRIADGSEGGTTVDFVTADTRKATAHVYRITTWHGTTPPQVGTTAFGGSVNPNSPTLTPSWGAEDTLWLAGFGAQGVQTVSVYPTSYTNGTVTATSASAACSTASARRELNATSDDPSAFTDSNSTDWLAQTVAIRPSASAAVTGTIAVTQAADVGALSGTVVNPITGTIGVTQAAQTMAATGTETISGTIGATQAAQTGALAGTVANPITGTISATQADQTGALTGTSIDAITGTIAATQADQTGAFVGAESFTGTIGANQDPNIGNFSGTVANPITGVIGAIQADQTAAFLGTIVSDGTLNSIQDDQTGTLTGTVANPVTGTIGVTQTDQSGVFTGTHTPPAVTGTIAVTQDDQTGSFTGIAAFGVVGVLGGIQQDQTGSFTGIALVAVTGTIAVTQDPNIGAFTGTVTGGAVTGVLGATQDPNVGSFTATVTNPILNPPGTITCVLSSPTAVCVLTAPTAACTILPVNVIAGSNVEITTTFHQANGTLADPTTVSALIQHPDGTTSAPTPTSSSVGIWTTVIPTDDPGFWFYQISGAGNDLDVVCVGSFCAQPSLVLV